MMWLTRVLVGLNDAFEAIVYLPHKWGVQLKLWQENDRQRLGYFVEFGWVGGQTEAKKFETREEAEAHIREVMAKKEMMSIDRHGTYRMRTIRWARII